MKYPDLITHLFSPKMRSTINRGMERCNQLRKIIGSPDEHYATIHVAGTNGKGSVCTKIAAALQEAGHRVGLFTSPHITCYRERIRVNGTCISEAAVESLLPSILEAAEQHALQTTFFEATTLLALQYFAEEKVDYAVIETGIGGRHDTTNMLHPVLSVITSIALEHTKQLGETIEEIAWEKGGIIKPCTPVVIGPHIPVDIMKEIATSQKSPLHLVQHHSEDFDQENQAIAKEALELLGVPPSAITKGLEAIPPCRVEEVKYKGRTIILDGAHNPSALERLFGKLRLRYPHEPFHLLFSLASDKDLVRCLNAIHAHAAHIALIPLEQGLFFTSDNIKSQCLKKGIPATTVSLPSSFQEAIDYALAHSEGIPIICGSFRLLEEAKKSLD